MIAYDEVPYAAPYRETYTPEPWADSAWPDEGDPIPYWTGEPRRCAACGGPVNRYNEPHNPVPICHPCASERARRERPVLIDDLLKRLSAGPLAVNRFYSQVGYTKSDCNNAVRAVRRHLAKRGGPRIEHIGNGVYRAVDTSHTRI